MKKILPSGTELNHGEYRIDRHLGGGGFGITYLGSMIQVKATKFTSVATEKTVVIKELYYEESCTRAYHSNAIQITDRQKNEEFARLRKKIVSEANILNSFRHPHIVEVFDVFEENNTAYIVMEYVEGEDLEESIKRDGKLNPDEAVRYISQIASALVEVHKKFVLHLDISPSNILIDKNNNARLIDFGISLSYNDYSYEVKQTSQLLTGKKSGFSPPEQSSISLLQRFSPPIDLYALGATLYNALTGQQPPESGLLSVGMESLPLPSTYNKKVSSYLDLVVLKAMTPQMIGRFQTAEEFRNTLLTGEQYYNEAIRKGNEYYSSGNYPKALQQYEIAFKWVNSDDNLQKKINRCKLQTDEKIEPRKIEKETKLLPGSTTRQSQRNEIKPQRNHAKDNRKYRSFIIGAVVLCFAGLLGWYLIRQSGNEVVINYEVNLQKGEDCFNKGDYECAKQYYVATKADGYAIGMDEKIKQCEHCLDLLNESNRLFENKNYKSAKSKYESLLAINRNDPHAKKQIDICIREIRLIEQQEEIKKEQEMTHKVDFYKQKIDKYYTVLNQRKYDYIYELFAPQVKRLYNIKTTIGRERVEEEAKKYARTYPVQRYEIVDIKIVESSNDRTVIHNTIRYWIRRDVDQPEKTGTTREVIVFNKDNQVVEMYNNNTP